MINSNYQGIKLCGIATAVPTTWQSLEELVAHEQPQNFNLKKFEKTTGVRGRFFANPGQTTADFCFAAAKKLLRYYKTSMNDIGAIVFVSQCSDYTTPATACVLQYRLWQAEFASNGSNKGTAEMGHDCLAFDVNLGCSGYVYGLNIVAGLLSNSDIRKALLLCGDTYAKAYSHKEDNRTSHSSRYLFGDAGTATLLEKTQSGEGLSFVSCTDGSGYASIIEPYNHWRHPDKERQSIMDDITVFNFSTSEAPAMLKAYMEQQGTSPADYDALLLHQANLFIMKQIAKRTGFPSEKLGISIDTFGNTSSASIPATLVKTYGEDNGKDVKKFLACGYGVGLSWAACELQLAPAQILPLIKTDECFDDGFED